MLEVVLYKGIPQTARVAFDGYKIFEARITRTDVPFCNASRVVDTVIAKSTSEAKEIMRGIFSQKYCKIEILVARIRVPKELCLL